MGSNVDLSEDEVKARLALYEDATISNELYDFGRMLLQDAVDRIGKLDSKASALAAYCGGLVTILISTSASWAKFASPSATSLLTVAVLGIVISGALAVWSMTLQKIEWFTQDEWLKRDCLSSSERLRRYHVLTMWGVIKSHHAAYRRKIGKIYYAQVVLVLAGLFLLAAFLQIARSLSAL